MAISSSPNIKETVDTSIGLNSSYLLTLNQTAEGTISSSSDIDFYKVSLVKGQTYTFALIGTGLNDLSDPILKLKDSSGKILLSNDDSGVGYSSLITYKANQTGSFYLDVQDFYSNPGQYGLSFTQGSKASFNLSMAASACFTDSLVWGSAGAGTSVTYGFRSTGVGTEQSETFSQLTSAEIDAVHSILNLWSDVANINFQEVSPGGYTDATTILFGNYNDPYDGAGAYAYYPGDRTSNSEAGDVWLNLAGGVNKDSVTEGSWTFEAILHEVGHAIGLTHPGDYNAGPGVSITYANSAQFIQDSTQYSVMSYFDGSNTGQYVATSITTPMMADIYELQLLYGANTTTRAGNTIYGFSNNTGSSIYSFSSSAIPLICIWDASGMDTLNCSGFSQNQLINLNEASFSNVGGGVTNVSIAFGAVIENATAGVGNDTILGNKVNNILNGGLGSDTAIYEGTYAQYTIINNNNGTWTVTDSVLSRDGEDTISNIEYLQFTDQTYALLGEGGGGPGLSLLGTTNIDTLNGGAGNDIITGLAKVDVLDGKEGSDLYVMTSTSDHTAAEIKDTGTSGTDEVRFTTTTASTLTLYAGDTGIEIVVIGTGTAASAITTATTALNVNAANLTYGVHITGNNGNNILTGTLGYNDTLMGGLGNDTYVINNAGDMVTEALGAGTDLIQSTISFTAFDHVENLTLTGISNINATGNSLNNTLTGNSGNNTLDGDLGNDTMVGGAGNDSYIVDSTSDVVTEGSNAGTDTIQTTLATYTLASLTNVENLSFTGIGNSTLTGNTLNNVLTGGVGNDNLNGGAGNDTMVGGLGDDTYAVDSTTDIVTEGSGAGTDTIQSSVTYTASANVENLTLTGSSNINATGNALANTLTGNSGINNLSGGNGNDLLFGGLGNDNLTGGLGNDTFIFNTKLNSTSNRDTITDFTNNNDTIQLSKSVMSALGVLGTLSANDFKLSTQTLDSSDRIIYNQTSGTLFYDADGSGRSSALQIAILDSRPTDIDYTDFVVVG